MLPVNTSNISPRESYSGKTVSCGGPGTCIRGLALGCFFYVLCFKVIFMFMLMLMFMFNGMFLSHVQCLMVCLCFMFNV